MNAIKEHVYTVVVEPEPKRGRFEKVEDLLALPWVAPWATRPGFHRFSQRGRRLLAEYHQGRVAYTVGYLREPVKGLPKWGGGE